MIRKILFVGCMLIQSLAYPQDKQFKIPLDKKEDIYTLQDLGDQGLVVVTKKWGKGMNMASTVYCFDSLLNNTWKVSYNYKVKNEIVSDYAVFASQYAPYMYIRRPMLRDKISYTRIDEAGKMTEIETKRKEIKGKNNKDKTTLLGEFVDEVGLHSISLFSGDKKKGAYLIWSKMLHEATEFTHVEVSLSGRDIVNGSMLQFIGQQAGVVYFAARKYDSKEGEHVCTVFGLNEAGEALLETKIPLKKESGLVPAHYQRSIEGGFASFNDFDITVTSNGKTTRTYYIPNGGAYGQVWIDFDKEQIVFFSVTGTAKSKSSKGSDFDGYIVQYFDLEGQLVSERKGKLSSEIASAGPLKNPLQSAMYLFRNIRVDQLSNGLIKANFNHGDMLYAMYISEEKTLKCLKRKIDKRQGDEGGAWHNFMVGNLMVCDLDAGKKAISYLNGVTEWRNKEFSLSGARIGKNLVVVRNSAYAKEPSINISLYNEELKK